MSVAGWGAAIAADCVAAAGGITTGAAEGATADTACEAAGAGDGICAAGKAACIAGAAFGGTAVVTLTGAASAPDAETGASVAMAGAACTLVTMAWAVIDAVLSRSLAGRSISERTTAAPAVAPMAVATSTTRAVRIKLGAGAK